MKMFRIITALFVAVTLTACGPLQGENRLRAITSGLASKLSANGSGAIIPPAEVTRAQIQEIGQPLLRVSILSRDVTAFVFVAATNGTKVTWFSEDGLSITLDRGVLIATRGLGPDLMGANVPISLVYLEDGTNYVRNFEFLDGLDQMGTYQFQCEINGLGPEVITILERTYQTERFDEVCHGEDRAFTNVYWRDAQGVIWQSKQWVSADLGFISYQRL